MDAVDLKKQIGTARYRALRKQAANQAVDFAAAEKRILAMANAKHPDNPQAATTYAAVRLIQACNSPVTFEELQAWQDAAYPCETSTTNKHQ